MANPNWVKGVSGNPAGRPPVSNSLSDVLREKLEELRSDGTPRKVYIAERLMTIAESAPDKEAVQAVKYIFDRLEGSPKQQIDATVSDRRPVVFAEELKDEK